jgi:hypothetical protein
MGIHVVDLPSEALTVGREIVFTFFWLEQNSWEGTNYSVIVE